MENNTHTPKPWYAVGILLFLLLLTSCYYHPSEKYLKRCGFVKETGEYTGSTVYDQWVLDTTNFYFKSRTVNYVYYLPVIHSWYIGVGEKGYTLDGVHFEINSKREFKLMLQDIANPDSL